MRRNGVFESQINSVGVGVGLMALFLAGLLTLGVTVLVQAAPPLQSPEEGKAIFQKQCASCHTVGGGDLVGPDLAGVTDRREEEWLARWISAPDKMLAEGDSLATELFQRYNEVPMPNLGLTEIEVASIIAYLETQTGGESAEQPAPIPAGDPTLGKDYFTGAKRFQSGGPACIACHSAAGIGALGGGTMGPDLTPAFDKYGGASGLDAFLTGTPTRTMNAIWSQGPLTSGERTHLVAFLEQASVADRSPSAAGRLTLLAGLGATLFLGIMHVAWRNRLKEVRSTLVD